MTEILLFRDKLISFYREHELFAKPIVKFIVMFIGMTIIHQKIGYMDAINKMLIMFLIALVSAFIPWSILAVLFSGIIIANLYSLTVEIAAIILVVMIVMFLLFFRFAPKDGILLILIVMAFYFRVPYVIPIAVGLVCTPPSIVSVSFGTMLYYIIDIVSKNSTAISNIAHDESQTVGVGTIVSMITGNKEMWLTILVFAVVIVLVYFIKRMSINNSWVKAITVGIITEFVILLVGNLVLNTKTSIVWLIVGMILSIVLSIILQFFVFSVDYSRIEHTQFEDDDYYYYVKAVPKINVAEPEMNIKRIYAQRQNRSENNKNKRK